MSFSLGDILGRALAGFSGLGHVHLPEGLSLTVAREIVMEANRYRPQTPAFAILLARRGIAESEPLCPVVSAKESISYRQGHHVAVVYGRQPDLSSFVQTFREIAGQSYPEGASGLISLRRLASVAADALVESLQISTPSSTERSIEVIEDCLRSTRELHAAAESGLRSWNSVWFDHVDVGFRNLDRSLKRLRDSGSDLDLNGAVASYAYACFALPVPTAMGVLAGSSADARAMNEALQEYWADEESFAVSVKQVAADWGLTEDNPLVGLNVQGVSSAVADEGDAWFALAKLFGSREDGVEAFKQLSQEAFVNPSGKALESGRLEVYTHTEPIDVEDLGGQSLAISDEPGAPFVVRLSVDVHEGGRQPQSELIDLRVPWGGNAESDFVSVDDFKIEVRPASAAEWTTVDVLPRAGHVSVIGRLRRKGRTGANARTFRALNVGVSTRKSSAIAPLVSASLSCSMLTFNSAETFLLIGSVKAKGALRGLKYLGREQGDVDSTEFAEELPPAQHRYRAILWSPEGDEPARLDGVALDAHPALERLFTTEFDPIGDNEFVAGNWVFRVRPVAAGGGQQSALLAAALKQQVTPDRPSAATEGSIRGQAEAYFAERLAKSDEGIMGALGHVLMPANAVARLADVEPHDDGAVLAVPEVRAALKSFSWIKFNHGGFVTGEAANRMRNAIEAMDFGRRLSRLGSGGAREIDWPSRTSWKGLWRGEELREYLDAYRGLVMAARATGHDSLVFWAAYPMSISVWDVKSADGCLEVLLSPLHPIRLAWLAGVERTLFDSEKALEHLGAVEGWNFPLLGPSEEPSKRFIAVPTDSGGDQLFLGWSSLVPASTGSPKSLTAPDRVGSLAAPGTAVSGLNSAAVDAALRTFRKMHPHLTTLTVDLSAREPQSRLNEIDEAVLTVAQEWGSANKNRLLGGVRVFDSIHRDGSAPRDGVTRLVRENHDMLLTWSRYAPDRGGNQACNIRFLQDAGSTISVANGGRELGILGGVPLRRFETSAGILMDHHSASEPGISVSVGWSPLSSALAALESPGAPPVVRAGMLRRDVNDTSADWTVLGESFLNPAVLAELMGGEGDGARMLWEWRPPVFDRHPGLPTLERRPFVSVARVPDSFGEQLNELLEKATGGKATPELRRGVMSTLGGRGVGLSSLLSMGGTHVAGALGFFLTFSLFDRIPGESSNRLVMPIDASDYFLRTLAGKKEHGLHQRRADLLLMELSDDELVLVPVEIKNYGLQSAMTLGLKQLPAPDSSDLHEPLDQLTASNNLFRAIEERSEQVGGADADLWRNSLAALVETAIKLSPGHDSELEQLMKRLQRVVDGAIPVRSGRPVLAYFQHEGLTSAGDSFFAGDVGQELELDALGLIANTAAVFGALDDKESPLLSTWRCIIEEAVGHTKFGFDHVSQLPPNPVDTSIPADTSGHPMPRRVGPALSREAASDRYYDEPDVSGTSGIAGDGVRIHVGNVLASLGNAEVDYWAGNTGLTQMNVGVVGDLGTGKTEFVKSFVAQVRLQASDLQPAEPTSILILDYKGDFQAKEFLDRVGGVVLEPYKIPLNIFMPATKEHSRRPYQQAAAFVDTLTKIYGGIGPVQGALLNEAIRDLYEARSGDAPTLAEVREAYIERSGKPDSVSSLLDRFAFGEIFEDDRKNLKSFSELLEGHVLVVALDQLGQDTAAKNALIALFLNLYYDFMIRSNKPPFQGADPQLRYLKSFLVVDEAINIMRYGFTVLMDLMLQGRQFGFGVVLSAQYLSHFTSGKENYGQPLRTWVIHRVPEVTAKEFAALGLPNLQERVIRRVPELGKHEALYKSFGWDEGRLVRVKPYYEIYGQ